jgi:hypothetical protein
MDVVASVLACVYALLHIKNILNTNPKQLRKKWRGLTPSISLGDIRPVCHTLAMLVNAGMQESTRMPLEILDSSSVGSNQISSPTAA